MFIFLFALAQTVIDSYMAGVLNSLTPLSLVIHNWLIRRTSALFASSVTYMMPIVSIVWGILDGETFLLFYLAWITLILVGVYLANRPTRRAMPPSAVP